MTILNKISNFLNPISSSNFSDNEILNRNILLNYTLVIIATVSLIFSILHFVYFEKTISYFLFAYFVVFLVIFIVFRKNENYIICSNIALIFIASLYLLIIFIGAGNKTGIIWGLTYPIVISITFDYKKANLYSLIFLFITLVIFFVPSNLWANYSIDLKLRYIGAYVSILFLLQYYLRIQKQLRNNNEKKLLEAKRKLYEKDELLSKLSYQIRTPLNNIVGITNLNNEILNKDTVEEIEISISNLINIVNSISTFSDNKAIKIKGKASLFNINNTIKKSVSLFQSNKYANLKCQLNLSDEISKNVYGDRLLFIQIILAVIDFFYNNKNLETLTINLSSYKNDDNSFNLEILSNTSIESLKNCVNEKHIVDIQKINNNEILVINDLVSSMKSKFSISCTDINTSFLFSFNFSEDVKQNDNIKDKDIENIINIERKQTTKLIDANILLVEDDAINSKIMTLNLKKYVKSVIVAENGKEALDKFSSTKIDLILMDIRMPLMDGYKTTKKIRIAESISGAKVPIIAVTANVSSETREKVFEVGMNDYVTKPINFKILIKKMEILLS